MSARTKKRSPARDQPPAKTVSSRQLSPDLTRILLPAAVIVFAVLLAYLPAMRGSYIWDDPRYVSENPLLRSADGLQRIWTDLGATVQYYPMVFTTFWIEYRIWQLDPTGYHVTNIILHAITAVMLWFVLRRLSVPGAWLAAAIFALHPIQVESVAWITERKNILSATFYMTSLFFYLGFEPIGRPENPKVARRWLFYAISFVLFMGALFSKTVTCSLPAAILLLIWWQRGRITRPDVLPLIPFFVAGAIMARVTTYMEKTYVHAEGADWVFSALDRILIAGRALWFYIWKLILPVNLTFNYPRWQIDTSIWWQYLFPLAAVAVVVVLWIMRKRIGRGPLVVALFYGGTLLPALGFTNTYPMRYSFVADHFQYLAGIGPIVLASALLVTAVLSRRPALAHRERGTRDRSVPTSLYAIGGVLLAVLIVATSSQAEIYKNRQTLWTDTLEKNPDSFLAHNNLATIYLDAGRADLAVGHLEAAVRIKPDFHEAHSNLGRALNKMGNTERAEFHCAEAVRLKPDSREAQYNLANTLARQGKIDEAIEHYEIVLQLGPDMAMAHNNLAIALSQAKRYDDAVPHFHEAIRLMPDYALARRNLGLTLAELGRDDEAIATYRHALRLQPNDSFAQFNLGELLEQKGDADGAIRAYRAALRLNPDLKPAREALDGLINRNEKANDR